MLYQLHKLCLYCLKSLNKPQGTYLQKFFLGGGILERLLISNIGISPEGWHKPVASAVFQGGKVSLGKSRGTKSESFIHTLCYHNQMYKVYAGKD